MHQRHPFLLLLLAALCFAGCDAGLSFHGSQSDNAPQSNNAPVPDEDVEDPVTPEDPKDPVTTPPEMPEGLAPSGMRLLTQAQYINAMKDIFESVQSSRRLTVPDDLQPDPSSTEGFVFNSELSYTVEVDGAAASRYARSAEFFVDQVFSNPSWRQDVMDCVPASAQDGCVRSYLERTARRAWARPITQAELDALMGIVSKSEQLLTLEEGLGFATTTIFESPHFLYRTHMGVPDANEGGAHRYTAFEVADRLALLIWSSVPDETLLDAAANGMLETPEQIGAQAKRMLDDERARRGLLLFVEEWLGLDTLNILSKDEDAFPLMTQTLGLSMRRELDTLFEHQIFVNDEDIFGLLTSRRVYINEELRRIYGIRESVAEGQWEWREVPEDWDRGGLLTTPGLMAMNATRTRTSPTVRGLFILERFLCSPIAPAPNNLDTSALAEPTAGETVREWNARIRENPQFAGCHDQMDPAGLTLEFFDGLGTHRGSVNGIPIESGGSIFGQEIADSWELQHYLKDSPRATSCLTEQIARHAIGVNPKRSVEPLAQKAAADGRRFKSMILDLVQSPLFLYGAPARQVLPQDQDESL